MKINISGLHVDLGESLQEYAEEHIVTEAEKYFDHPTHAEVKFSKRGHIFHVEILLNDGTKSGDKSLIKTIAEGTDVYKTFDLAIKKLDRILLKYKGKLRDLHRRRIAADKQATQAIDYVIDASFDARVMDGDDESGKDNSLLIAETSKKIERLSVKDAVMKLELMQLPALTFINSGTGVLNFIYMRDDGNISWVDTSKLGT